MVHRPVNCHLQDAAGIVWNQSAADLLSGQKLVGQEFLAHHIKDRGLRRIVVDSEVNLDRFGSEGANTRFMAW